MLLQPIKNSYGVFKFFKENRDISQRNVERISESIEETYLLDLYPIVTNREKVIVDGQHRFTVAREMLLPFYVIESDDVTVEDIAKANSNTRAYTLDDARMVYAKLGLKAYEYINAFIEKNHISGNERTMPRKTGVVMKWLNPEQTRSAFVNGDFVVRQPEYAQVAVDYIQDYVGVQSFIERSRYTEAIANLALNPNYSHERMMGRLKQIPTRLQKVATIEEAFQVLTSIYNYNIKEEKRVKLAYLGKQQQVQRFDHDSAVIDDGGINAERGIIARPVQIKCTSDYAKFSLHSCRRPVKETHRMNLYKAMKTKSLLDCYPIVCDTDLTIIDGQVRFWAAQELRIPLYYIESSSVTLPMVVRASANSKSWTSQDYLKHYCSLGYSDYLRLADFWYKYPFLDMQTAMLFVMGIYTGYQNDLHKFKSGQFAIRDMKTAVIVANGLGKLNDKKLRTRRTFQIALYDAVKLNSPSDFNLDVFIDQANQYPELMVDFADKESCRVCMTKTYNHRNPRQKFTFETSENKIPVRAL